MNQNAKRSAIAPNVTLAVFLAFCASSVRGDQLNVAGANYTGAKFIKLEEGRVHFRAADGRIHQEWLSDVNLLLVDRTGMFDDFNQAERQMDAGEPEKAVLRYERAIRLSDDSWAELIAARMLYAYDRIGQFDKAASNFVRVARGQWTGPALAARLLPRTEPVKKDARLARGIEVLDSALANELSEAQRILFEALRFEWLHTVSDPRANRIVRALSTLPVPEPVRTQRLYDILEQTYRIWLEKEPGPESLAALNKGLLDCPVEKLPDLLMLKGETLGRAAQTKTDAMRASWPYLRVIIHSPRHRRTPEAMLEVATLMYRVGSQRAASELLRDCLAHPELSGDTRALADALPSRAQQLPPLGEAMGDASAVDRNAPLPAEEQRLGAGVFREGLKARGMTELLELHIKDYPTSNPTTVLLMAREVKLADYANAARTFKERRGAIAEANRILRQLIDEFPSDARRMEWRYTLGSSLLFEEADSFATKILLGMGGEDDRKAIAEIARRALDVTRQMARDISDEYARIDGLTVEQFEDIERTGYLDVLDKYAPSVDYLNVWALFYDALGHPAASPQSTQRLNEVLVALAAKPALMNTPHAISRVQIPALLVAGMTHRRLNDHAKARSYFERAATESDRIVDAKERARVQWAVTLVHVEGIANDREEQLFDEATARLNRLKATEQVKRAEGFGLRLAAALLERSILLARADMSEKAGRKEQAATQRESAVDVLVKLIVSEPEGREEVFAALYGMRESDESDEALDPIEKCALAWGLLRKSESASAEESAKLIARAVAVGEGLVAGKATSSSVMPEAQFQLASAYYKQKNHLAAAKTFLRLAQEFPTHTQSLRASALSVQLLAQTVEGSPQTAADLRELFGNSLRTLIELHPASSQAAYWRFAYAQWLSDEKKFESAAKVYDSIDATHPRFLEALYQRIKVLARLTRDEQTSEAAGARFSEASAAVEKFEDAAAKSISEMPPPQREATQSLRADAQVMVAQAAIEAGRPQSAIELLKNHEIEFPGEMSLLPAVWRVRFAAFESLGKVDEAASSLAAFARSDPKEAGRALQSIYSRLTEEAEQLHSNRDDDGSRRKFTVAMRVADELVRWSRTFPDLAGTEGSRALRIQLAEATLNAGNSERALTLFDTLLNEGTLTPGSEVEPRLLMGHAEALFARGDFAKALPEFNRLATRLPPTEKLRWRALLQDLQCRTLLNEPAQGILKVIEQQRYLYPDLGGPELAEKFDALARQNAARASSSP